MASLYIDPDHEIKALARLLEQDKTATLVKRWLAIKADRIQRLENLLWQLHQTFNLDDATGHSLDVLGAIVGEARQGRDDDTYRLWIRARARANRASGTPNDNLEILKLLLEPTAEVEYLDTDPRDAEYYVQVAGSALDLTLVKEILSLAKPAGVQLFLIAAVPIADAFRYDVGPGYDVGQYAGTI